MKNIIFNVQKNKDSDSKSLSLPQLYSLLGLDKLNTSIISLEKKNEELKNNSNITKEEILKLIKNDILIAGQALTITNVSTIEKKKNIPVGTLYFNVRKDCVRIKKKSGWDNF